MGEQARPHAGPVHPHLVVDHDDRPSPLERARVGIETALAVEHEHERVERARLESHPAKLTRRARGPLPALT
jgi:hypothetical protein